MLRPYTEAPPTPTEGLTPLPFVPFELERWQSTWENRVRYNLSESGVHPLSIQELLGLAGASPAPLLDVRLGYSQSNGTDLLRGRIAALYDGVAPEQILVTTGSAEANFVVCWRLVEPGDKVAVMLPNYLQTWGLAQNFGAEVRGFTLRAEAQWEPALAEVRSAIAPGTKLVVVTNPHNPTGHVLSKEMREAVVSRAAEVGAWLLADEVYQGAERDGATTPSFWGSYERVIVVNGLSKAYGLPGLRIGWVVAPPGLSGEAWARHDYTTIGPAGASDHLAALVLEPAVREKVLARTRGILRSNYPVIEQWLKRFGDTFSWHPPQAGAICLVRYRQGISALDLVEKMRAEHDVLLVPGDHFGLPHHIRFGFGEELHHFREALAETERGLKRVFAD